MKPFRCPSETVSRITKAELILVYRIAIYFILQIETTANPAQTEAQEKKTPWWVIFLAVLGGVLLLAGAIVILYKVSAFCCPQMVRKNRFEVFFKENNRLANLSLLSFNCR